MHPKSPKWLEDIAQSCAWILEDTAGLSLEQYLADRRVRQSVERNLEIIGEASSRLRRVDPETAAQIPDLHQVIGLRNRLAHGYDEEIDHARIWQFTQDAVGKLRDEAAALVPPFD